MINLNDFQLLGSNKPGRAEARPDKVGFAVYYFV